MTANTLHYYAFKTAFENLRQEGIKPAAFSMNILYILPKSQEPCSTVHRYIEELSNRFRSFVSYPTHTSQRGKADFVHSHPLSRNKVTMRFCPADITYDSTSYSPDNIHYVKEIGSTGSTVRRTREPAAVVRSRLP